MKVSVYATKNEIDFFGFLQSAVSSEKDFLIIFAPFYVFTEEFFKNLKKISVDYVAVSTIAVLNSKEYQEDFIQGIVFSFERQGSVKVFYQEDISLNFESVSEFLEEKLKNCQTNLIFSTASNVALNIIIDSLSSFDKKTVVAGGIASSNSPGFTTKLVYNGQFINDGFVVIQFNNVDSLATVSSGFIPVGPSYRITKSHLNRIYEIDGISSYFFLEKILRGTGLVPEDLDMEKTSKYLWSFPFIVVDKNFGHMTFCRTPKEYSQKEGAFKFWGNFKEGDRVKISIGDPDDIIETAELDTKIFKYHLMESKIKPEFILNFSCVARYELLKKSQLQNEEARIYKRLFLTIPMAGMLTFGEIAPEKNERRVSFYNQTSVLIGMWER